MSTPDEARRALTLVTNRAVATATDVLYATNTVDELLVAVPEVIAYYADGTAALAADHYDDLRDVARVARRFRVVPVVDDRVDKVLRAILWAAEPLHLPEPDRVLTEARLAGVVQLETARPFRSTILTNSQRDPASVGWKRNVGVACKFCRMLAGRGAVYRESTARFAAHAHCDCTASPVFDDGEGPEASTMQYVASQPRRTPAQRQALREYLAALPD